MDLHEIQGIARYYAGAKILPAGAIPLASERGAITGVICLMPSGAWVRWIPNANAIYPLPPEVQRDVMEVVIGQLGGTSAALAERLDVSPRTVEAWRSGKAPLSIKAAYQIAEKLAEVKS
jgi:DNA-binding XRE family transcriptional regulator